MGYVPHIIDPRRQMAVRHKKNREPFGSLFLLGDLSGARTQDPLLKREMLYLLS